MNKGLNSDILDIKIIYFAALAGQIAFLAVAIYFIAPEFEPQTIYRILAPLLAFTLITVGFYIYRQPLKKLEHLRKIEEENILDNTSVPLPDEEINQLYQQYKTYSIIRIAMVEMANIIILLLFMFTGDYLMLFYFLLVLIVYGTTSPSIRQFARDYDLTLVEERALKRD